MKEGIRQSMAWLHTWSGLLVGWILFMVFAAGTASYFRDEITLWMKPELHGAAHARVPQALAVANAVDTLQEKAPASQRWFITLPTEREPGLRVAYAAKPPPGEGGGRRRNFRDLTLDPATGAELSAPRETRGGDFLYRLHFDLHYMSPIWGRWIVGFCAMFMLVAILSGIVTHKRIFKDFFTFRPKKGQRSWLDFHNVSAVLALPYHLMITYTGLLTLVFMYFPQGIQAVYQDKEAFYSELFNSPPADARAAKVAAPLAPLAPMVEQASRAWNGAPVGRVTVAFPNDANATVSVTQQTGHAISYDVPTLVFDGVTGRLVSAPAAQAGAAKETRGVMYGLHVARFADPFLRWLFFACGLAGCMMVATGLLLWAVKERPKHLKAHAGRIGFGLRLVDGLNIGAVAGLPLAMAVYFWANRLVETGIAQRPEAEIRWFFTAWGIAAVAALARPGRPMWRIQLAAGGLAFALLPLLNGVTGGAHLGKSIAQGLWPVAGFDIVALLLGAFLLYGSHYLGKAKVPKAARAMPKTEPEPELAGSKA